MRRTAAFAEALKGTVIVEMSQPWSLQFIWLTV